MRISPKNDYGYLFNGMGSSSSSSGLFGVNLSDYKSIKTGGYGKLLKSYYKQQKADSVAANKTNSANKTDETKKSNSTGTINKTNTANKTNAYGTAANKTSARLDNLNKVSTSANALKSSALKLTDKSKNSVFAQKEVKTTGQNGKVTSSMQYDRKSIYDAVKDFTDKYNSTVKAAGESTSSQVKTKTGNMTSLTSVYKRSLENVGIKINQDNTLSIDEEKFNNASVDDIKKLFGNGGSFVTNTAMKSQQIENAASTEADSIKNYNSAGSYADYSAYSVGSLYNGIM